MMRSLSTLASLASLAAAAAAGQPWMDASLPPAARAAALLKEMTQVIPPALLPVPRPLYPLPCLPLWLCPLALPCPSPCCRLLFSPSASCPFSQQQRRGTRAPFCRCQPHNQVMLASSTPLVPGGLPTCVTSAASLLGGAISHVSSFFSSSLPSPFQEEKLVMLHGPDREAKTVAENYVGNVVPAPMPPICRTSLALQQASQQAWERGVSKLSVLGLARNVPANDRLKIPPLNLNDGARSPVCVCVRARVCAVCVCVGSCRSPHPTNKQWWIRPPPAAAPTGPQGFRDNSYPGTTPAWPSGIPRDVSFPFFSSEYIPFSTRVE